MGDPPRGNTVFAAVRFGPWVLLALVVVGAVLRVVFASHDLLADELATYWIVSTRDFPGVIQTVSTDAEISPPLSFLLSWLTTRLGLSPEMIRLPAIIGGSATIPLVYLVGLRTVGRGAALLGAALITFSPFMIFYSAEARAYGVLMALVVASTYALLRALKGEKLRWWVGHGLLVCAVAYTHYTAIFLLLGQFGWAFACFPAARRRLVLVTAAAAIAYIPWLPGLQGDLASSTTKILDLLSPFTGETVRSNLVRWSIGYPIALPHTSLSELPGVPALLLLAAAFCVGIIGAAMVRDQLGRWWSGRGREVGLVAILAVATPLGAAIHSAVATNVFSVRNLAASLPYLAVLVAALITIGPFRVRLLSASLAIAGFASGAAVLVTGESFKRPAFSKLSAIVDNEYPDAVIIEGLAFTPGPLTNLDVEHAEPDGQVFRLAVAEQDTRPFSFQDLPPDPADVARRAIEAADGGPIVIFAGEFMAPAVEAVVELLPEAYELTDTGREDALFVVRIFVYEQVEQSP